MLQFMGSQRVGHNSTTINNVVIDSGEQQRHSAIHTHVSILLQTPLSSRLPQNIEQFPCYTVGPCCLSILNIAVFIPNSLSIYSRG